MPTKSYKMFAGMHSSIQQRSKNPKKKKKKKKNGTLHRKKVHTSTSHVKLTHLSSGHPPHPFRTQYAIGDSVESISNGTKCENLKIAMAAFFIIAIYVGVGVLFYSFVFEQWSIEDSMYFSITTLTTVGYGDLDPSTPEAKLFTVFFAFLGIGIIALALGVVGSFIIGQQEAALRIARKKLLHQAQKRVMNKRRKFQSLAQRENNPLSNKTGVSIICDLFKSIFQIVITLVIGAAVEAYLEDWSAIDSLYYATITATTIGYGDYAPEKKKSRWFSMVYIPFAVITVSRALSSIANIIIRRKINSTNSKILKNIMKNEMNGIPSDDQGRISELMFFKHMLLAVGKVDVRTLDFIRKEFHKYDPIGRGFVDLGQKDSSQGSTAEASVSVSSTSTETSGMETPIFGPQTNGSPFISPIYSPQSSNCRSVSPLVLNQHISLNTYA